MSELRKDATAGNPVHTTEGNADIDHNDEPGQWRLGTKVPINVYDGDRPVCQCHTVQDAQRIVAAVNACRGISTTTLKNTRFEFDRGDKNLNSGSVE